MEVTARPFITILFTEKYADATPVFMIYMLIFMRSSIETGSIIQVFNRTVFLLVGFVAGFCVNVGLGVLLFNAIGRLGVPLSALLTLCAVSVVNIRYSARLIGSSFFELFPARELAKRFLAAAVPGAVMWALYGQHPVTTVYELAAAGVIYAAMYALVCMRTRLVTLDDIKSVLGRSAA
jgi:O-antigen/teichoic acid export membrane protein